ncbi:hypothetical protein BGZ98_000338 [Dissophora globulifera]|nr:hypothetical protein BGZ98_000338 [Dissophora globulifera]
MPSIHGSASSTMDDHGSLLTATTSVGTSSDVSITSSTASGTTPRTSMTGTRASTTNNGNSSHGNSATSASISAPNSLVNNNSNNNQLHHHYHTIHNNSSSGGLRRFPSIGNTKKLTTENLTLKSKVTELERYLTGLKEELVMAHRQIHAQRVEIKTAEERKLEEVNELTDHIQKCEFELGGKILECVDLQRRLVERQQQQESSNRKQISSGEPREVRQDKPGDDCGIKNDKDAKIMSLMDDNLRKDTQIVELLEKVDRLGTEVLSLEREKALLALPALAPAYAPSAAATSTPTGPSRPYSHARRGTGASSLKDLTPITAEAIIAATTPHTSLHNLTAHSRDGSVSGFSSNSSLQSGSDSTSPSSANANESSGTREIPVQRQGSINSVGYDLSVEHSKLLAKFQALRMQHAQAAEYLDSLESENQELKVQLLDVK